MLGAQAPTVTVQSRPRGGKSWLFDDDITSELSTATDIDKPGKHFLTFVDVMLYKLGSTKI